MISQIGKATALSILLAGVSSARPRDLAEKNEFGFIVREEDRARVNYTRSQLGDQSGNARSSEARLRPDAAPAAPEAAGFFILPVWSYGAFGSGIGESNIVTANLAGKTEIYLGGSGSTFGDNEYWQALRYDAVGADYRQSYVSPRYSSEIARIAVADLHPSAGDEIVIALRDGRLLIHQQSTKWLLAEINTAADFLRGLSVDDVDGDGSPEIILSTSDHLYVLGADGTLEWDLAVGGDDVITGQLDSDAPLEIAVTGGQVVDADARSVQWSWPAGFGADLEAADIDGDGMQELVAAEHWYFVWAYDVDRKLPKWSIPIDLDIGAIDVVDIDEDSVFELLVGDGQWGSIHAFDTRTQQLEWSVANPEHGVTDVAAADVDGDGKTELLWGAGATSTGPDHFYVVDWRTADFEWQNPDLVGPFLGPRMGDLDGDGRAEIVTVSFESDASYGSGRILVFDAGLRLRAISAPIVEDYAWTGTHDLELRDVDGDGNLEILVAADWLYDGVIEIYDFASDSTFSLRWTNATRPSGAPFHSVDTLDVDGDGDLEVVGGGGREHTGADGVFIYVYDFATGNEEWHSLQMGEYWDRISGLKLADYDQDGHIEIAGMVDGGDVYVFDGATKELEAILFGEFTTLETFEAAPVPYLLLGDVSGDLVVAGALGDTYVEFLRGNFLSSVIDGVTLGPGNQSLWLGSDGRLALVGSSTTYWTSADYGRPFGKTTLFYPGLPFFLSAGKYSLVGFWVLTF